MITEKIQLTPKSFSLPTFNTLFSKRKTFTITFAFPKTAVHVSIYGNNASNLLLKTFYQFTSRI